MDTYDAFRKLNVSDGTQGACLRIDDLKDLFGVPLSQRTIRPIDHPHVKIGWNLPGPGPAHLRLEFASVNGPVYFQGILSSRNGESVLLECAVSERHPPYYFPRPGSKRPLHGKG